MAPPEISRRRAITLAAFAALGGALAPGALRLASSTSTLAPVGFAPPGFRFLDSVEFGIRVAIPDDLVSYRPWDLLAEDGMLSTYQQLAARSPVGVDEYLDDQLNSTEIIAVSEDGTSVNVMRVSSDSVPTAEALADEVAAMQLQDVVFDRIPTVFGAATTMRSTMVMTVFDQQIAVPGHVLWAQNTRGVFSIQLAAEDPDVVDALYCILLRTLQPAPQS